jgi:hypothetical protein
LTKNNILFIKKLVALEDNQIRTFAGTKVVGIFVGAGGVVSELLGQTFAAASHDCCGDPIALDVVL